MKNSNRELLQHLWTKRHQLTKKEWLEASPILLGYAVSLQNQLDRHQTALHQMLREN